MRLVVPAPIFPPAEREDAVGGAVDMDAVPGGDGDPAGQQAVIGAEQRCSAGALELRHRLMLAGARVVERVGDRGLRPQQQPRLAGGPPERAARRSAASSSKPGRHLSCWPMLG